MKKTKHFNISVPELGDVPDITQVSNAISDLEDATASTLEIMKAEMQGTKITLTSVSRKTKRIGYYEGMSIRFKSPQDIEPNYLKTISVDGLGDQTLSIEYKVNRNEYIDIVYEGNKFTAYPVVVQKTDSVSENSSILVGTAKGVKTAYDKGVDALNKANQAQSSANNAQSTADGKVSKSGDTMTGGITFQNVVDPVALNYEKSTLAGGFARGYQVQIEGKTKAEIGLCGVDGEPKSIYIGKTYDDKIIDLKYDGTTIIKAENLNTQSKEVVSAINELHYGKENSFVKKSGFNLEKSDSVSLDDSNILATSKAVKIANDNANSKLSINGGSLRGDLSVETGRITLMNNEYKEVLFNDYYGNRAAVGYSTDGKYTYLRGKSVDLCSIKLMDNGHSYLTAYNLQTKEKEVISAINSIETNKLDKNNGGYVEGETRFNKSLNVDMNSGQIAVGGFAYGYTISIDRDTKYMVGVHGDNGIIDKMYIGKAWDNPTIEMFVDGSTNIKASNLRTSSKEVVGAINEIFSKNKSGSTDVGYWEKNTITGRIIQFGHVNAGVHKFPIPFSTENFTLLTSYDWDSTLVLTAIKKIDNATFKITTNSEYGHDHTLYWFAIGY